MTEVNVTTQEAQVTQILKNWVTVEESIGLTQANLANASAILFDNLKFVNWAGFYLYDENLNELILGPFVGKPAVVRIKPGNGVVGTSYEKQETQVVANVHLFEGHIACDPASNSEIVIPLTDKNGKKLGVLDIDSTVMNRFGETEKRDLEQFVQQLLEYI